jgi:hypothetical protein
MTDVFADSVEPPFTSLVNLLESSVNAIENYDESHSTPFGVNDISSDILQAYRERLVQIRNLKEQNRLNWRIAYDRFRASMLKTIGEFVQVSNIKNRFLAQRAFESPSLANIFAPSGQEIIIRNNLISILELLNKSHLLTSIHTNNNCIF